MSWAPMTVWRLTISYSSGVRRSGFSSSSRGIMSLPMSWRLAAMQTVSTSAGSSGCTSSRASRRRSSRPVRQLTPAMWRPPPQQRCSTAELRMDSISSVFFSWR